MVLLFPETPRFPFYEIIFWGGMTAGAVVANFTIGLPLYLILMCCTGIRHKAYVLGCEIFLSNFHRNIAHYRNKLFEFIKDHERNEHRSEPLRILEIGVGAGRNFEFYPENCSLTSLDVNPECESDIRSKLKNYPKIKFEKHITSSPEDLSEIENSEYDVVVATYLLCSVNDVDAVLKEVRRVLKKGGKFVSVDHVEHPQECFWAHLIQRAFVPVWKVYGDGCILNRDVLMHIKKAGFSAVSYKTYYPSFVQFHFRSFLIGVCTK